MSDYAPIAVTEETRERLRGMKPDGWKWDHFVNKLADAYEDQE